jgi:hypothetical protein
VRDFVVSVRTDIKKGLYKDGFVCVCVCACIWNVCGQCGVSGLKPSLATRCLLLCLKTLWRRAPAEWRLK